MKTPLFALGFKGVITRSNYLVMPLYGDGSYTGNSLRGCSYLYSSFYISYYFLHLHLHLPLGRD
jgi:hypothetical protein